jgi:hypothetical protein
MISLTSYSQDCNYLKNEKDEFTGKVIIETWGKLIREFSGSNANLIFRKVDSSYLLLFNYTIQMPTAMVVGKNDELILKLSNDVLINFKPLDIYTAQRQNVGGILVTQIRVFYTAEKAQIKLLAENDIRRVRFNYSNQNQVYADHDVKEKNASDIIKAATCILLIP